LKRNVLSFAETETKIEPEWSRFDRCWVDKVLVDDNMQTERCRLINAIHIQQTVYIELYKNRYRPMDSSDTNLLPNEDSAYTRNFQLFTTVYSAAGHFTSSFVIFYKNK